MISFLFVVSITNHFVNAYAGVEPDPCISKIKEVISILMKKDEDFNGFNEEKNPVVHLPYGDDDHYLAAFAHPNGCSAAYIIQVKHIDSKKCIALPPKDKMIDLGCV